MQFIGEIKSIDISVIEICLMGRCSCENISPIKNGQFKRFLKYIKCGSFYRVHLNGVCQGDQCKRSAVTNKFFSSL